MPIGFSGKYTLQFALAGWNKKMWLIIWIIIIWRNICWLFNKHHQTRKSCILLESFYKFLVDPYYEPLSCFMISWLGTARLVDCFNRVFGCYIKIYLSFPFFIGRVQPTFGWGWALPGPPLAMPPEMRH